jgi:nitronate monooxygenase
MTAFSAPTVPIIAAPMAGGPTTPELTAAVCEAGGMGLLAAGYRTADQLAEQIARTRSLTGRPFGVNLFVPGPVQVTDDAVEAYRASLAGYGIDLPVAHEDDDGWDAKLALLERDPVAVVTFTFGLPSAEEVRRLHAAGSSLVATVTSAAEARSAEAVGVDALCVQGPEAGGHRGTHRIEDEPGVVPLPELLAGIGSRLPIVAAGGVGGPADVARLLAAGAVAVQVGTLFLRAPEAGTSQTYRDALVDDRFRETVVTRAFTGRPARGLRNAFINAHGEFAPAAYPQVHQLTRPLRAAAAERGDAELLNLWAGTGYRGLTDRPAAEIVRELSPRQATC